MELSRLCCDGIYGKLHGSERSCDGDVSGTEYVAIEILAHVFGQIDTLNLVHLDHRVEAEILEIVPVYAS